MPPEKRAEPGRVPPHGGAARRLDAVGARNEALVDDRVTTTLVAGP
jgi:hypothetical protein